MSHLILESPVLVVAVLAGSTLLVRYATQKNKLPLPPSPPAQWFLGNVKDFPGQEPWLHFTSWKAIYGDIVHLKLVNKHTIILNSKNAVLDLLEGRSNIYSNRPGSVLFDEIADRGTDDVFRVQVDDPVFKSHRRMMHTGLGPRAVREYQPLQIQETTTMLQSLVTNPDQYIAHIRRNAGALIMKVTYGYTVSDIDDFYLKMAERHFEVLNEAIAQPYMIEFFPILKYLPSWAPFTAFRKMAKLINTEFINDAPFNWAKQQIESGSYIDSVFARLFHKDDGTTLNLAEQRVLLKVCEALYVGGADTTVAALISFIYVMETHPEIQKRVQREVDSVTGGDRLPLPVDADETKMPYLGAVIKETVRWAPVAPLGLFHSNKQDDIYEGYFIPKDSQIIPNIWAITHDPEIYPNPDVFDPERHLGENKQENPFNFVFGFGRRSCPGSHLAERSLFQNTSNILALFDINKKKDSQGNLIEPKAEFQGIITSHLKEFPVEFVVRSPSLLPTSA